MRLLKIGLLLSALALFIFACGQNNPAVNTNPASGNTAVVTNTTPPTTQPAATAMDELAEARAIFTENCVGCHKADGTGGEKTIEGKKIKVPNYKSPGAMKATDDELLEYIANGEEGEMPAFKNKLSEAQMKSLVKFIRREFQDKQ
jgi:mono/diheme cytochrome c family protein